MEYFPIPETIVTTTQIIVGGKSFQLEPTYNLKIIEKTETIFYCVFKEMVAGPWGDLML
jgi:hypothetical protein